MACPKMKSYAGSAEVAELLASLKAGQVSRSLEAGRSCPHGCGDVGLEPRAEDGAALLVLSLCSRSRGQGLESTALQTLF